VPELRRESIAMSEKLSRFLRNLSVDPSLLEAFETDSEMILTDADLSEEDKDFLRNNDPEIWRRALTDRPVMPPGA
jgi:hypothetical protein